ncbi:MAG: hypothetical protein Q7S23_03165 [bacterium]|nr:hypothetical protein [bacterium]
MQPPLRTPRRGHPRTWLVLGTLALMGIAFITLKIFSPSPDTAPSLPAPDLRSDWQKFLVSTQQRWEQLREKVTGLWENGITATSSPVTVDAQTAEKIRIQLEQRLGARLGIDLAGLQNALPPGWRATLASDGRTAQPAAILTVSQTAPCRDCTDQCLTPPEPIRLHWYARAATPSLADGGDCEPRTVATTTAFLLIDPCTNTLNCENRGLVKTTTIQFFQTSTTTP